MAMNTVYYSAVNLLQNHDYRAEPAGLAMSALTHPGVDKIDFELWALAVSALSSCAACLNAHESELRKRGVSLERIHAALRIAAVVASAATTVRLEAANSGEAPRNKSWLYWCLRRWWDFRRPHMLAHLCP